MRSKSRLNLNPIICSLVGCSAEFWGRITFKNGLKFNRRGCQALVPLTAPSNVLDLGAVCPRGKLHAHCGPRIFRFPMTAPKTSWSGEQSRRLVETSDFLSLSTLIVWHWSALHLLTTSPGNWKPSDTVINIFNTTARSVHGRFQWKWVWWTYPNSYSWLSRQCTNGE